MKEINIYFILFYLASFWSSVENQKQFFREFSYEQHFDPLQSQNWYSISKKSLFSKRVSNILIAL